MKNSVKIGLSLLAGGTAVLANHLIRKNRNKVQSFQAPDGNSYKENEMYRTAQGEIYKNGRKMHFETPELLSQANRHIDTYQNNQNVLNGATEPYRAADYHHKGVRHH